MVDDPKRYNHKYLVEKVYNDLSELVSLLHELGALPLEREGLFLFAMRLQRVSANFTQMANEQQYAESEALRP